MVLPSTLSVPTSGTGWRRPGALLCPGGSGTAGLLPCQPLDLDGMGFAGRALWGGRGLEISYRRKK